MNRILGHVVSLFVVGLAVSAALPACATNDQTIFIHGALAPSLNRANGVCTYTADPQQAILLQADADLGVTDSYFSVLLVGNQLIPRGDPANNRAESNRAHLNGAIVRITETDGTLIREFTSSATGIANPANNNTPDFGVIGLVTLDAPTRDILLPQLPNRGVSKTILIKMKVFGVTLGGTDLESGEYQLPMRVCNGCLVDFSTGNDPANAVQPNCLKPASSTSSTNLPPCFIGQDEPVKCETCVGARAACSPNGP